MEEKLDILIFACGYTGQRVAKYFLNMGFLVTATARNPQPLAGLGVEIITTGNLPKHVRPGMLVVHFTTLILLAAAIYGPVRGFQESIQPGEHSLSDRFVGRIHVDDLGAHVESALLSTISGAYPVAGEEPCTSRYMTEFCPRLPDAPVTGAGHKRADQLPRFANNRRVDGSAIRKALGITRTYPSYRVWAPAALSGTTTNASAGHQQI